MSTRYNIPPLVLRGLEKYRDERAPVGSFLTAVLGNDLHEAVARADVDSMAALKDIGFYLHWEMPPKCWGSPEKVAAWLAGRGS